MTNGSGETGNGEENSNNKWKGKEIVSTIVGVVALGGFGALIIYLLGRTAGADEKEWIRAIYLLNGVEAVAFAAAGYFFGREVHRQRAERAEEQADAAQANANDAQLIATEAQKKEIASLSKLKSIRAAIKGQNEAQAKREIPYDQLRGKEAAQAVQADLVALQTMVDDLLAES